MNWLAHVFLSPPEADFRLGNLLADVVRGPARDGMSAAFRAGAACHLRIDAFTDSHAVVKRSKSRLQPAHRRYAGILVDLFYDHFLAARWPEIAGGSLEDFTREFYIQVAETALDLPEDARQLLRHMIRHDRLGSYREIAGIEAALHRLSQRWTARFPRARNWPLAEGCEDLRCHYEALEEDFLEFFPLLQAQIGAKGAPLKDPWSRCLQTS